MKRINGILDMVNDLKWKIYDKVFDFCWLVGGLIVKIYLVYFVLTEIVFK
tara:strand:- start:688 stop:837 length:150 start_codon:yes stop_codon:yes gene_type:complete